MKYKNGREAKNGDKVVLCSPGTLPVIGILYDVAAGGESGNEKVALVTPSDPDPNLNECWHMEDVRDQMYALLLYARRNLDAEVAIEALPPVFDPRRVT